LTVAALVLAAGPAFAGRTVSTTHSMPVRLQANLETSGCENSPGPYITLSGAIILDGVSADIIFRNNAQGTHQATVQRDVEVVLLPDGQAITIPKQPVLGGTGGNPFIWIQVLDDDGKPLTREIFLGRCVQGLSTVSADFFLAATSSADITVGSCSNQGPEIELSGEVALSGINARLIFRNNDNKVGGPHSADEDVTLDIVILPEGESIVLPKQPVLGGVGGNPLISVQFLDGAGDPIGSEFKLGRCVQLDQ
jgi:hypothetical protein